MFRSPLAPGPALLIIEGVPAARLISLVTLFAMLVAGADENPSLPKGPELWFYYATNLQVASNLAPLESVFRRAAAAGYTQVYLTDSKFARLGTVPSIYFDQVAKVRALARSLHLEIVPGIFPVGWSDSLLSADPDLVEALPVRDALFVVEHGTAQAVADPPVSFPADGFGEPRKWAFIDPNAKFESGAAHVSGARGINARAAIFFPVRPFHQYVLTFRIKTLHYTEHPLVEVLSPDTSISLNAADLKVAPPQEWTAYHVVFNSLAQKQVLISFRAGYTGSAGEMWWDRPSIAEAGLLNLVRRDSCPLTVRVEQGTTLKEGVDYDFITDPKMGHALWPGSYDVWHEPPQLKTHLPDGTRLRISFCHAITTGEGKVSICLSEPKSLDLLRDQARRVDALFHARRYFMEHDEIRVLGWDDACRKSGLDSGALLAGNMRACIGIMKEISPVATLYVWSDMFDPFHNAHANYYLVRGNLAGSWEGLDPAIVVANWNSGEAGKSLPWFAHRGHHQLLAGYYDSEPENILPWLAAARGVPNIDAVMYTTWNNNYADLEKFAQIVRASP